MFFGIISLIVAIYLFKKHTSATESFIFDKDHVVKLWHQVYLDIPVRQLPEYYTLKCTHLFRIDMLKGVRMAITVT